VRDKLGVDLESGQCVRAATLQHGRAEVANHVLDAGGDVVAIKRGHASIVKGREIPGHPVALDRAMPTGQLPAAANATRDAIARLDFTSFRQRHGAGVRTAVTSSW